MSHHLKSIIDVPNINGVDQAIIIRGPQTNHHPVILHVHGGPGEPEGFSFIKERFGKIEQFFTICYWGQRGSGKSYSTDIPSSSMNLNQFVNDTMEVSKYLIHKFGQDKIYILGHSWGTLLASHTIHRYPDLYHAYLGIGQVAKQIESEKDSLSFIQSESKKLGDLNDIEKISKLLIPNMNAPVSEWIRYLSEERYFVGKYNGSFYKENSRDVLISAMKECEEYTQEEKENFNKGTGNLFSMQHLWPYVIHEDLNIAVPHQSVPVFIFQGIRDYQTSYAVAKKYFEILKAPHKAFYSFEKSAHFPHLEEYEKFERIILKDILSTT